jgi:hypothetical protein
MSLFGVMPDALLALWTILAFIFLSKAFGGGSRWWIPFWAVAALAALTHGRGAVLLLVPWLTGILLYGWAYVLRKRELWIAMVCILALAGPLFLFTRQIGRFAISSFLVRAALFPVHVLHVLGVVAFVMMIFGGFAICWRKERCWMPAVGIVLGNWAFFSIVAVPWDDRYLMAATPAFILLIYRTWQWSADCIFASTKRSCGWLASVLAICTVASCMLRGLPASQKPNANYGIAASRLIAGPDSNSNVFLVAGDVPFEGAFIAAAAFADQPIHHIILRSTKALRMSDMSKSPFQLIFHNASEVADFLTASPVSTIIVQDPPPVRSDLPMLAAALTDKRYWEESLPIGHARIYRRVAPLPRGPVTIKVDIAESLQASIEWIEQPPAVSH